MMWWIVRCIGRRDKEKEYMKILFFVLFLFAAGLIFYGLNILICRLAYPKDERFLHCRIICAVLLVEFALANVYTISLPLLIVDKVINSKILSEFFSAVLPNRSYELLYMLLSIIGLNLLMTLLILLTVLAVKALFHGKREFVDIDEYYGFGRITHIPWMITGKFYEEHSGKITLNGKGFSMGIWAKGMKMAFLILWIAEMLTVACAVLWGGKSWNAMLLSVTKAWYLLPMAGFLLVEQIQLYLEGTNDVEAGTFGSVEIDESLSGENMDALMEVYRKTFSGLDVLLYSEKGTNSRQGREGLYSNDLGNRQVKDCAQPDVLHVISKQLRECGVQQCDSYQNVLVELLNGHSVNVRDHGEGEFLIYLAAYLNYYLSQGKTALILCQDQVQTRQIREALKNRMKQLNNLYSVWNICGIQDAEANGSMSILVCTYSEFLNSHIKDKRSDFVSDLFCTVIVGGSGLFSQDGVRIELLFNELRGTGGMQQFVMLTDEDNDTLRTAMEVSVKQELLPFNNDSRIPNTNIMIWKEESCYKLQRLIGVGNAMSPYLGTVLPLALTAVKYDMPEMYVIPDPSRGDGSYGDVMAMSSKEIAHYLDRNVNLKSVIRYMPQEALEQHDISMILAYDTDFNFFNALWRWMKYGGTHGTLIHIISPPYLLREYFAANFEAKKLLLKNNEFDALFPYSPGMKNSHMAVLMVSLCNNGLTEEELMEKSKEFGWNYENAEQVLADCLKVVLRKEEMHSIYECFHFEKEKCFREDLGCFLYQTRVTMTDATIRKRLMEQIAYANLIFKDNQTRELTVLKGNIHNYYLSGQIAAFDGYLYRILSVNEGNVYAEQELPQDVPQYYPISDFSFENYCLEDACIDNGYMDMNFYTASVTRRIYGYWSSNQGNDFCHPEGVYVNDMRGQNGGGLTAKVENAHVLEIRFRKETFGDNLEQMVTLCAYILNEMFKTLFPATYQNIFAVTAGNADADVITRVMEQGADSRLADMIRSMIPYVQEYPGSSSDDVVLYLVEFSCIEYGMVKMFYNKRKSVFSMMREYLSWYLGEGQDAESDTMAGSGLHFGADSIPDIFAAKELLELCAKIAPEPQEFETEEVGDVSGTIQMCTFCGRVSLFPVKLADHRCMCGHCKDHQITQRDEIKQLFVETVKYMEEGYSIRLRKNIHVRFQSADAIRKATGGVSNGRILGFYNASNHQLWLEARGPKVAMQSTLIHELTHAWQFDYLDIRRLLKKLPKSRRNELRLMLLEGHAVYVEIETMRKKNETEFADRLEKMVLQQDDEYGKGYRLVYAYIKQKGEEGSHMTPFAAMECLVTDIIEGKVTLA